MDRAKTIEACTLAGLLLLAIFVWTIPFQKNQMPFGDVDSSTHFTLADSMGQTNKPIANLPAQFNNTYYLKTNGGKLWYFPQYHTGAALFQIISGNRIVGAYLFFALMSTLIVISLFMLIKELFGLWPAAISSFWIIFSTRDMLWYVLGVYPQVAAFGMVPLFLYCAYKYINGYLHGTKEPKYAYLGAIILVMQIFTHPQSLLISVLTAGIYALVLISTRRKLPFNFVHVLIGVAIFAVLVIPFIGFFASEEAGTLGFKAAEIGGLFKWYGTPVSGMSPDYYSFTSMHGPILLPLAIVGVILLFLRRKNEDLLMLSWLLAFYITLHMGLIGLSRSLRFMEVEAHILVPIAVVGALRLPGIISMPSNVKNILRMGIAAALVGSVIFFLAIPSFAFLNGAFSGAGRITPAQLRATEWIKDSTNVQDTFYLLGTPSYAKRKWMRVLSLRQTDFKNNEEWTVPPEALNHTYVVFDYSDFFALYGGFPQQLASLPNDEARFFNKSTIAYSKDNIRVYRNG